MPPHPENDKSGDALDVIRGYLRLAIQIGAPSYNHGDQRGCYEVYACTARLLIHAIKGADQARSALREALEQASTVPDVDRQAWIMRHAFDAVLGETAPGDGASLN